MMTDAPNLPQLTPGQEGHAMACAALMLLHRHQHAGLPTRDIQVFLGLDRKTADQVLGGLESRGRITCQGRGTGARWVLTRYAAPRGTNA